MSIEENKAIARRHYIDVFNQGHVELVESYYAPEGSVPIAQAQKEFSDFTLWWQKVAPGWKLTILDMVAEGEKVAVYLQAELTYSVVPDPPPDFVMPPFGKPVSWKLANIVRIVDGKWVSMEVEANDWTEMLVREGVYTLAKPVATGK
jgi:predicted ester cyclase